MGDHFSSSSYNLVGSFLLSSLNSLQILKMRFFAILFCVASTRAFLVRREADAEAEADADAYGYGAVSPAAVSAPVCSSVPEKVCKDRTIETPRQVCHTEHDEIVDTTITEHCEETITTKCEQVSSQTRHSSGVVGHDSKVVATGIVASPEVTVSHGIAAHGVHGAGYGAVATGALVGAGYGAIVGHGAVVGAGLVGGVAHAGYGKREADAEADADADAGYGYATPVATSAPICSSVPVRTCNKVPVSTPRKVAKTVCKEIVDVQIIQDCTETVSTTCTQQSTQQSHSSAVVGADTRVGPEAVVAHHGTIAVAAHAHVAGPVVAGGVVAAGYGAGYGAGLVGGVVGHAGPVVAGYAGTGAGLAGYAAW